MGGFSLREAFHWIPGEILTILVVSKPRFEDSGPNLTKSDQISPKSVPDQYQTSTRPGQKPSLLETSSGVRLRRSLQGQFFLKIWTLLDFLVSQKQYSRVPGLASSLLSVADTQCLCVEDTQARCAGRAGGRWCASNSNPTGFTNPPCPHTRLRSCRCRGKTNNYASGLREEGGGEPRGAR